MTCFDWQCCIFGGMDKKQGHILHGSAFRFHFLFSSLFWKYKSEWCAPRLLFVPMDFLDYALFLSGFSSVLWLAIGNIKRPQEQDQKATFRLQKNKQTNKHAYLAYNCSKCKVLNKTHQTSQINNCTNIKKKCENLHGNLFKLSHKVKPQERIWLYLNFRLAIYNKWRYQRKR